MLIEEISDQISRSLMNGGKIMWAGNGGSASQSQHFSAELAGRLDVSGAICINSFDNR